MLKEYSSDDELSEDLRTVLAEWPLYRKLRYKGAGNVKLLPSEISLYCSAPDCVSKTRWARTNPRMAPTTGPPLPGNLSEHCRLPDTGLSQPHYRCKNCTDRSVIYFCLWNTDDAIVEFQKVGQYPAPSEEIDPVLRAQLQSEDLDFFTKAIRSRNFSYGLASVSYLRRVVENKMNWLLDLMGSALADPGKVDSLSALEKVKKSTQFADKVEIAKKVLPAHLRPGGSNPFDSLHDIASDGIHNRSDEECIEIFDQSRLSFEYLIKNLIIAEDEARRYAEGLTALQAKKEIRAKARQHAK